MTFIIAGYISQEKISSENVSVHHQPLSTTAVDKYTAHLQSIYLRSKLPIKGKWPPSPCMKIIKLAAVEKKDSSCTFERAKLVTAKSIDEYMLDNSMTPVSLDNILDTEDGSHPKTVVIQGAPGIGKSTFAWRFCRKWAKGKLFQNYQLVVLLRMRDRRVREATKLIDLFNAMHPHNQELTESVTKDVVSRGGKGVLLLFEGLDELPLSLLTEDSILLEILQGFSLPKVTLVVTSRPWAVQTLIEKCTDQVSRQFEILGFTKDDVASYVSNAFCVEEKKDFMEYLNTHPQLEAIMHNPMNAAFILQIYKECKLSKQAIPQTMTQLYSILIKGLLIRYMKPIPEFSELKVVDLRSLPEPIRTGFEQLCLLAFMSFTKLTVQVTFTDSETALSGYLDALGLMQSSANLSIDTGTTVTHSFLHFTIQEFLAAYHLSLQSLETQALFYEIHSSDPQFAVLLGFLIVLNSQLLQKITFLVSTIDSSLLHWLHESQSPIEVAKFLGSGVVTFKKYFNLTPFDIYTLTYCLCHSNCKWDLHIDLEKLTSVFPAPNSDSASYLGRIDTLVVGYVTGSGLERFFSLPKILFSKLSQLIFYASGSASVTASAIAVANLIKKRVFPNLVEFGVVYANSDAGKVVNALQVSCPCLTMFCTQGSVFTPSDMLPLCKYICYSKSLTELSLVKSEFQEDTLQLLISAIPCAKSVIHLDLSFNQLSPSDVEMLSVALSVNSALKILKLKSCSIKGEGAEHLATGLKDNHVLEELYLDYNTMDTRGASALSEMLFLNTSLKVLDVRKNDSIGVVGALTLMDALEHNNTLKTLYVNSNH